MHVKLEPSESLDLPVDLINDIESDLFRQHLFGNINFSNSDVSESSSDDDHLSKFSACYEPFPDTFGENLPPSVWEPVSRSNSSTSDSFDQTLAEMDLSSGSLHEIRTETLDIESATCSSDGAVMSHLLKEEGTTFQEWCSDSGISGNDSATSPLWDFLCSNDIKPNIKTLETPPVSPPESYPLLGDSPPPSPSNSLANSSSSSSPAVLPSRAVITVTNLAPKPSIVTSPTQPRKKVALAPKIPFKIVTTISANAENRSKCLAPRTIKIQPKSAPISKPVVSVTNSTAPKFNINKTGSDTKLQTKQMVHKPLVIATPQTPSFSTPTSIPTSTNTSTCTVVTGQKQCRLPLLAPALNPAMKNNSIAELRAMKRQQRMIKNRESASLSRKRKKEYLQGLEDKVRELDLENARLRAENERLLRRVTSLENEKVIMRAARFPIKRSSTALLGLTFLLLFNASPLRSIFGGEDSGVIRTEPWISEDSSVQHSNSWESKTQFSRRSLLSLSPFVESQRPGTPSSANLSHVCPISFNTTESIRIENELRDWFDSSAKDWPPNSKEEEQRKNLSPFKAKNVAHNNLAQRKKETTDEKKALAAPLTSTFPSASAYLYRSEKHPHNSLENPPDEERPPSLGLMKMGGDIQSLLDSIDRRNDTYYVVSLTADHLLLPATAHNTSARPKMSLLVPTPKGHGDQHQVGLMQIDCVVTHTRLVRWTQHPEVPLPSVPVGTDPFAETTVNTTDSKDSSRKDKTFLKKRKRRKFV